SAGAVNKMNQKEMISLIKDIGEIPAKRDTNYNILKVFN
ncbi:MAG: dehypoxanthine futalosine cyclase, partial [Nautiliaceae bacterium]